MSEGASGNLYEAVLAGLATVPAGDSAGTLPPVRASASVVPWPHAPARGGGGGSSGRGGVEVFWVKRGEALAFMGGWHAFPGAALSRSDAEIPVLPPAAPAPEASGTPAPTPAPALDAAPDLAPGILACAIRELFEETGILLVRPAGGAEAARLGSGAGGPPAGAGAWTPPGSSAARAAAPDPVRVAEARRALLGGRSFAAVLQELRCVA